MKLERQTVINLFGLFVHAVNNAYELMLQFPHTNDKCNATANEFAARSKAGFNNYVGCINGVLL